MKPMGIIIAILGIICVLWFRYSIEKPAMTLSEEGRYPEMYGPVSALRLYIYGFLFLMIVGGIAITVIKHLNEESTPQANHSRERTNDAGPKEK